VRLYRPGNMVANRYEVQDVLGIGPVSATYLVREQESQELLALKVINSELTISEAERESCASSLRKLSETKHPHLREIFEVDAQGSVVFYTAPHYNNGSLRSLLRTQQSIRFSDAESILHQICRALSELPAPHGGLRPENIMLAYGAVRISDMGLCVALPKGSYVGALRQEPARVYLAPELLQNLDPTPSSDVFALGALCVELLTGQAPNNQPINIAKKVRVNESLDELLENALSLHSSTRIETPQAFAAQLSQVSRLTVFIPKSATLPRAELIQKLKESVSEPVPAVPASPKPLAKTITETTAKTTNANAKTAEIPRPAEQAAKPSAPKPPEAKPNERPVPSPTPLPKALEPVMQRPPEPKAAKTTEFPKPNKPPESKINIPVPKPPVLPLLRLTTGEQEIVRSARFPESKINIPIRPESPKPIAMKLPTGEQEIVKNRPTESPSKATPIKQEAPKQERVSSAPNVRAIPSEQEPIKIPKPKGAEMPHDPEPTQVSAKIPEAFAAMLAAENEAKNTQPIDPALLLLRPMDTSVKGPDPYLFSKTNPITSRTPAAGNQSAQDFFPNRPTAERPLYPEMPKAPEPTVSTRIQDISDAPKLPEPTSVYVKNPDNKAELISEPSTPKSQSVEYPSVDSVDLFVDVDEIEEDPLNPFAEELPAKALWPRADSNEDSETTGIRPLPSRRTSALPLQDPGDDLFSSYPEPPPFDPPEEK
jgi:serine/threonine protein kinase